MKFKAAIISLLSAMLIVGIVTAALLVAEAKTQTALVLEMTEKAKEQVTATLAIEESTKIQEDELKKQTDIAQKTAELILIQTDSSIQKALIELPKDERGGLNVDRLGNTSLEVGEIGRYLNKDLWEALTK